MMGLFSFSLYSENNTDTKAERGAKSIRRKKGGNKMEFVFEHATMIAVIAVVVIILAILASGYEPMHQLCIRSA